MKLHCFNKDYGLVLSCSIKLALVTFVTSHCVHKSMDFYPNDKQFAKAIKKSIGKMTTSTRNALCNNYIVDKRPEGLEPTVQLKFILIAVVIRRIVTKPIPACQKW